MDEFSTRAIAVIRRIPRGKVTTYGMVAAAAGNHCGARQVARILYASSDKHKLPWHRVVNRKRKISPRLSGSHFKQKHLLESEGISFDNLDRIDFTRYLWIP
jgi:methylated-DNA-protein-cysteine methyltransferase-like protein